MPTNDKSKRLSKKQIADQADRDDNNELRRSVKRSNLVRQQEFKKLKKTQKRTGNEHSSHKIPQLLFRSFRKIRFKSG